MKYIAEKMVKTSRFYDLYNASNQAMKKDVLQRITNFVKESKYTDLKNYGHLCNIFSSMAFCFVYESYGYSRDESIDKIKSAMYEYLQPQKERMQKLSKSRLFIPFLKIVMPVKFKKTLGYGWKVEFPKCKRNEFTMITYECIYCQIFEDYKIKELGPAFCKVDDLLYDNLPGADFIYTQQKACGGEVCDYTYRRKEGEKR